MRLYVCVCMCVCVGRPVVKSVVPLVEWRSEVILFTIVLLTWQAAGRVDSRSVSLSAESLVDYVRGSGRLDLEGLRLVFHGR